MIFKIFNYTYQYTFYLVVKESTNSINARFKKDGFSLLADDVIKQCDKDDRPRTIWDAIEPEPTCLIYFPRFNYNQHLSWLVHETHQLILITMNMPHIYNSG